MKHILVCVKAVPVSSSVEVDGQHRLKRDGASLQWNIADESALEAAFRKLPVLVQAADAISAARPGARRETLSNYLKRLEKLEEIANSFPGVEKCFAIQAGREIRIIIKPDMVSEEGAVIVAKDIAKRIEDEMVYPGQIKVNVVRETRTVEYAK